jgi:hypothetical protein
MTVGMWRCVTSRQIMPDCEDDSICILHPSCNRSSINNAFYYSHRSIYYHAFIQIRLSFENSMFHCPEALAHSCGKRAYTLERNEQYPSRAWLTLIVSREVGKGLRSPIIREEGRKWRNYEKKGGSEEIASGRHCVPTYNIPVRHKRG